jgi:ferritin
MFHYNSIKNEPNSTLGFMQWYEKNQQQQQEDEKSIGKFSDYHVQTIFLTIIKNK